MIWPSQSSKYKLYQDRKLQCLIHAPSLAWSPEPWIYISFNQYSLNVLVKNFQTSKINRVCVCDLKAKYATSNQWPKQTDLCLCSPSSRIQTFMVSNWLPWLQSPTSPRNYRWVSAGEWMADHRSLKPGKGKLETQEEAMTVLQTGKGWGSKPKSRRHGGFPMNGGRVHSCCRELDEVCALWCGESALLSLLI